MARLAGQGFEHVYVDGGATITSCLDLKLIDELTITTAPVLLGGGLPLFGRLAHRVDLERRVRL